MSEVPAAKVSILSQIRTPSELVTAGEDFDLNPADEELMKELNTVAIQPASAGLVRWGMDMATFYNTRGVNEMEELAWEDAAYWPNDDSREYQALALRVGVAVHRSGLASRVTMNQVIAANNPGRWLLPTEEARNVVRLNPEYRERAALAIGETTWRPIRREYAGNALLAVLARLAVEPFTSQRTGNAA